MIPSTGLHILPSLIPEAVLGTKEPSEKARSAAFDLIVAMAKKMSDGGVVNRNMVDGMDLEEGGSADGRHSISPKASDGADFKILAKASVEEYLTMIAGGLAGATPHMISASITAISRVVFEFKG